jgi:hypothetical protein
MWNMKDEIKKSMGDVEMKHLDVENKLTNFY